LKREFKHLDRYRLPTSPPGADYGAFLIPYAADRLHLSALNVISSGHDTEHGWEHVSVSIAPQSPYGLLVPSIKRCPTWNEMNPIKNLFWEPEETVVQFHPKASEYVNNNEYVLHMWKKIGEEYELPPKQCV